MTVWHTKDLVIPWNSFLLTEGHMVATVAFGYQSPSNDLWYTPLVEVNQALAAWSFRQISSAEFVSPIYNLETIGSELSQIQPIAPNLTAQNL